MALDVQRNWDICMAENLEASTMRNSSGVMPLRARELQPQTRPQTRPRPSIDATAKSSPASSPVWPRPPVNLPNELILMILDYVKADDEAQYTLASCTVLSRQWLNAAVPLLYAHPRLFGQNYDPFVRAICPSINVHVRASYVSNLVKVLDMSRLVQPGSNSITARLLRRTRDNLEVFVAPQANFAVNCYPALAKCKNLRILNLSLVNEAASLHTLFNTVKGLAQLRELRLPRSSGFGLKVEPGTIVWSPHLERLYLSGGIDANFLYGVVRFPTTLNHLTIEHCPFAKAHAIRQLFETLARENVPLRSLELANMPRLGPNAFDTVLTILPHLEYLSVSSDYVSPALLDAECLGLPRQIFRLRTLELTYSGNLGIEEKLTPVDVMIAMDEGVLPELRQVRVANSLGWHHAALAPDLDALGDQLREAARRRDLEAGIAGDAASRVANSLEESTFVGVWMSGR